MSARRESFLTRHLLIGQRLQTTPDPALLGPGAGRAPIEVTEVLLQDPGRDLVLLRAPGLAACNAGWEGTGDGRPDGAEAAPPRAEGEALIGIRNRDGY